MDDDGDEMNELASAAELPSYPELVAMVADLSERLAAREKSMKVKVWDWTSATEEKQQGWLDEIQQWMHKTLFVRWPDYRDPKLVPVCWREHPQSIAALEALYFEWWKTYKRKVDEDLTGWFVDKWLETLTRRARQPAKLCGSIYARPGMPHIHLYDRAYHALMEGRYEEKRPYPMAQGVVIPMPTTEPSPVGSLRQRRRDGEGRGGWSQTTS